MKFFFICIYLFLINSCQEARFLLGDVKRTSYPSLQHQELLKPIGNLVIEIESQDEIIIDSIKLILTKKTPETREISDIKVMYPLPIPVKDRSWLSPGDITSVDFSQYLILRNGNQYYYSIPEGSYYAYLGNEGNRKNAEILNPIESKEIIIMFGYDFDYNNYGAFKTRKFRDNICYVIDDSISYYGKNRFSCPMIQIDPNKKYYIKINMGKKEINSFAHIFLKFIPGIVVLAPFHGLGYYYHRDYFIETEIKNQPGLE